MMRFLGHWLNANVGPDAELIILSICLALIIWDAD